MGKSGIAEVATYVPGSVLEPNLAEALGVAPNLRVAGPDEDGLTMSWSALSRLRVPVEERRHLLLAGNFGGLEPRAVAAHLAATGVIREDTTVTAVHNQADLADVLELGARCRPGTIAIVVDHQRGDPTVERPLGDCAVAVVFGEPRIAELTAFAAQSAMAFDRWQESDPKLDRDTRFVEERLVARQALQVLNELRKHNPRGDSAFVGTVATASVPLRDNRLTSGWDVPKAWLPVPGAREPGESRAQVLAAALGILSETDQGASLAVVNIGWGASGVLLTAGEDAASAAPVASAEAARYGVREWLAANRPPYTATPWTSAAELSREIPALLGLVGVNCAQCGTRSFPRSAVCEQCGSLEVTDIQLEPTGTVLTHSIDELYAAPQAVQMIVVSLDGGGQFYGQAIANLPQWLEIGDRCQLALRRLHTGSGLPHYYWKVDANVR